MLIPCLLCGSTKNKTIDKDYINHMVCEYEVVCAKCESYLNYWAYGYYQGPNTLKELINWKPYPLWMRFEILFKMFYWIVRNKIYCQYKKGEK